MLAGVDQNPDKIAAKAPSSLWEGAKWMANKAWENKEVIGGIAKHLPFIGGLFSAKRNIADIESKYMVKENYVASLR